MRIASATFILTAIAGIHAGIINPEGTNDIGTFDTFTAPQCSGGGSPIAVEDGTASGELPEGVLSIRSHLSSCTCKSSYNRCTLLVLRWVERQLTFGPISGYCRAWLWGGPCGHSTW